MAEYIEREATASAIRTMQHPRRPKTNVGLAFAVDIVNMMPAADVAPVVRCKDCKHSYEDLCGRVCSYGVSVDCVVPDDFFCADGAKMDLEVDE